MILSLTCTATDAASDSSVLGFLLHKHPDRWYEKPLTFGAATVHYPESSPSRTTACLSVRLDPVALVRNGSRDSAAPLAQYVSDRPYAASSFLSVAIAEVFGTALSGRCATLPNAVDKPLTLSAHVPALACDGGEKAIRMVFEPLGYAVAVASTSWLLDDRFPEWGAGSVYAVTVSGTVTVRDLLTHLYVLIPVLDNAKHYFVDDNEVEKLLRRGDGWLHTHPLKTFITSRYLRYRRTLTSAALERLSEVAEVDVADASDTGDAPEPVKEAKTRLNDDRVAAALDAVRATTPTPKRVVDLGCGEGKTLTAVREAFPNLEYLAGVDVSASSLTRAGRRLKIDRAEGDARERLALLHGSLVYHDDRLQGFDFALLMEVIEHVDEARLPELESAVFGHAKPRRVLVTTPNAEYNTRYETLPGDVFRHADHRFEWTRAEFQAWANGVAERNRYNVAFSGVGNVDPEGRGTPTQMAVFDRA